MSFSLNEVEEARTDTEHKVEIKFGENGNGKVLEIFYKPLTEEIMALPASEALATVILRWNAEEKPTAELFRTRPATFLNLLVERIRGDFFRASKK